jgi:TetR/AcrR family transcriptional repressor of nem operon
MPRQVDTRDQILAVAQQVIQTRSFSDFSYQDVADQLDLRKASVHYHFPTKTDLGVAMLMRYQQQLSHWMRQVAEQAITPPEQLKAYVQLFGEHLGGSGRICPGGIFSAEWNTLAPPLQDALQQLLKTHENWLIDLIWTGQKTGHFGPGSPETLALLVGATLQGALQVQRAMARPEAFAQVAEQLLTLLRKESL